MELTVAQVQLSRQLRARGYPLSEHAEPVVLPSGIGQLQRRMEGESREWLTQGMAQEMLRVNSLQADVDRVEGIYDFGELIKRSLTVGVSDYCSHEPLSSHSDESRELLAWIRFVGAECTDVIVPSTDAVHYDFHQLNILWDGEVASAVIDWDGSRIGDRRFDVITLDIDASGSADESTLAFLRQTIVSTTPAELIRLYMAHMVLRVAAWNIAYQSPQRATRRVNDAVTWMNWVRSL